MEKKRTTWKLKTNTNMDQEPYPNQEMDAEKTWMALDTN